MNKNQPSEQILLHRKFMKNGLSGKEVEPDQKKGVPQPPITSPPQTEKSIALPQNFEAELGQVDYLKLLQNRRSRRLFAEEGITLQALSFMLYSTQGVQQVIGKKNFATLRPVPSGGCRHPFETYITVRAVQGLQPGLYHYLPQQHSLEFLRAIPAYSDTVGTALGGQAWAAKAAAVLFWAATPYRTEWRYANSAARLMLMDAGHIGQNAYLSAEALGLATCCCAAYAQQTCDELLGLDGEEEFTVYMAPVGVPQKDEE
ncbi:SagB/ThcOx family dehydrogenase [Ruminococcaceae bacterium OttesenSCG-928-A16]|nr:SagB/ThcOx family dehydrogenase [Ruminococcaceae bacterium OttesenSCG-928-A16]